MTTPDEDLPEGILAGRRCGARFYGEDPPKPKEEQVSPAGPTDTTEEGESS